MKHKYISYIFLVLICSLSGQPSGEPRFDWTIISSCSYDINTDGFEETVSLLVKAQIDESGEIFWDDGHEYKLILSNDGKEYIIYQEFITLANVEFVIGDINYDNKTPAIYLIINSHVNYKVIRFQYSKNKEAYISEVIVSTDKLVYIERYHW